MNAKMVAPYDTYVVRLKPDRTVSFAAATCTSDGDDYVFLGSDDQEIRRFAKADVLSITTD